MIFGVEATCIIDKAKEVVVEVAEWFTFSHYTFIRVFRSYNIPHLILKFVTNKVVMQ